MAGLRHLRARDGGEQRASHLELFFDLVFVFAITQISHFLIEDLTAGGVARAVLLLLVTWWAWNYTTWMTNAFDPVGSRPVRLVLLWVMGLTLIMSIVLPYAFGSKALAFASAYVALQVSRNAFTAWGVDRGGGAHRAYLRVFWWSLATGSLWIAGALVGGELLVPIWCVALVADYLGPMVGYWTPRLGATATHEWSIDGGHFSERFSLLIIIALGESIVVTGATAGKNDLGLQEVLGVAVAFATTACLWWLYFNFVADRARERLQSAKDPERLARNAYTYLHVPIVGGIILTAVSDELLIAHPGDPFAVPILSVAGPVLYLLGHNLFRLSMAGSISMNRLVATFALLALLPLAATTSALAMSGAVLAVLLALIIREEAITVGPLVTSSEARAPGVS